MIAVLSPAKTLDYARPLPALTATTRASTPLADAAADLGQQRLMDLIHVSPALASLNAERFGNFAALPARIDFREIGTDGLRFDSFAAKRARGAMAHYLCEHRLGDPEALKGFDQDGYAFAGDTDDADVWRFVRG